MVSRLDLGDLRARFREALLAWSILTASALTLTLIATPLAFWMDRPDLAILVGFVLVAPMAACALWWALTAMTKAGALQERKTPVWTKRRPGASVTFIDLSQYEEADQQAHSQQPTQHL
jgi:hypothetical protein